jgi:REP element-mobilizing transposase RayT
VRDLIAGKRRWTSPQARQKTEAELGFKGWHERGYLPHRDTPDLVQFVTFRLADSFPAEMRGEWEALVKVEDDLERRRLLEAWVIMPNHVHALLAIGGTPLAKGLRLLKGYTARAANKLLGRRGEFWAEDSWDTYMRDHEHEMRTRRYVESNPVKAGLVAKAVDWPWGSARFRDQNGELQF